MRQHLLCAACGAESIRQFGEKSWPYYPGEYVRHVKGTVVCESPGPITITGLGGEGRHEIPVSECCCDQCNVSLPVGEPAVCRTIHDGDYLPWEHEYIHVTEGA